MKMMVRAILLVAVGIAMPKMAGAQGLAGSIGSLQTVLDKLLEEMLPMCSKLIGVGRGIAGFGATWYIAHRVWKHISNAEPVDFYPLFRPFVLGFCIIIFPSVIDLINGVMKPTVTGTTAMVERSNKSIALLLKQKEEALKKTDTWQMYVGGNNEGDREKWYKYTHDGESSADEGMLEGIGNDIRFAMSKSAYNMRNSVKEWMSQCLQILFEAAALCINTLRTFQLIVLAIIGPLVFGIAVFDGFQHTLTGWLARYINIFLWLPVANIFGAIIGKIQEQMIKVDLAQIGQTGDTFFSSTDVAYLVFMLIGIIGYFTVPSVANSIITAGGAGAMLHKVTSLVSTSAQATTSMGTNAAMGIGQAAYNTGMTPNYMQGGYAANDKQETGHMADKLSGKS